MFTVTNFDFLIDHHTSEDESGYPVLCVMFSIKEVTLSSELDSSESLFG